jgi:hypothetical protein
MARRDGQRTDGILSLVEGLRRKTSSHPSEKEKNPVVHNPALPFGRTAFFEGRGIGWRENLQVQPNVDHFRISAALPPGTFELRFDMLSLFQSSTAPRTLTNYSEFLSTHAIRLDR